MKYGTEQRRSLLFAPTQSLTEQERPVCRHSERCKGYTHAGHGFICWHRDGSCLRTDMEKLKKESVNEDDNRSNSC